MSNPYGPSSGEAAYGECDCIKSGACVCGLGGCSCKSLRCYCHVYAEGADVVVPDGLTEVSREYLANEDAAVNPFTAPITTRELGKALEVTKWLNELPRLPFSEECGHPELRCGCMGVVFTLEAMEHLAVLANVAQAVYDDILDAVIEF